MIAVPLETKGGADTALRYLFAEEDAAGRTRPREPILIEGSWELFSQAVTSSKLKRPYQSWVISYEEQLEKVGIETIKSDVRDFRSFLTRGLPRSRHCSFAVLHEGDQGGCHAHVLESSEDLLTGRQIPMWSGTVEDMEIVGAAFRAKNLRRDFSDPGEVHTWRMLEPIVRAEVQGVATGFHAESSAELAEILAVSPLRPTNFSNDSISIETVSGYQFSFEIRSDGNGLNIHPAAKPNRLQHRRRDPDRVAREVADCESQFRRIEQRRKSEQTRRFGVDDLVLGNRAHVQLLDALAAFGSAQGNECGAAADRHCDILVAHRGSLQSAPDRVEHGADGFSFAGKAGSPNEGTRKSECSAGVSHEVTPRPELGDRCDGSQPDLRPEWTAVVGARDPGSLDPAIPFSDRQHGSLGRADSVQGKPLEPDPYEHDDQQRAFERWRESRRLQRQRFARSLLYGIGGSILRLGGAVAAAQSNAQRNIATARAVAEAADRRTQSRRVSSVDCESSEALSLVDANCELLVCAIAALQLAQAPRFRALPTPAAVKTGDISHER